MGNSGAVRNPCYFAPIENPFGRNALDCSAVPGFSGSAISVRRTSSTRAKGGPRRSQVSNAFNASASPQANTSTRPSDKLFAWPQMPSANASLRAEARKNTPCTFPLTRNFAQGMGDVYGLMIASRSFIWIGPRNALATLPSGAIRYVFGKPLGVSKSFGGSITSSCATG